MSDRTKEIGLDQEGDHSLLEWRWTTERGEAGEKERETKEKPQGGRTADDKVGPDRICGSQAPRSKMQDKADDPVVEVEEQKPNHYSD